MRKPVVLIVSLVVMLGCGAVASAATAPLTPTKVSAGVTAKVKKKTYQFIIKGTLTFPRKFCPAGVTNPAYCTAITAALVCKGKVRVTIKLTKDKLLKKSNKTIKTASANLSKKCKYSLTANFKKSIFTAKRHAKGAKVRVNFSIRFLGNSLLKVKNGNTQHKNTKLAQP